MKILLKNIKPRRNQIDDSLRNQLILDYTHLIKFIAQKIVVRLPDHIELDDLISVGILGLMDAIDKYDPSKNNKFKTYAEYRIKGAILDELRSQDWVPRSVRGKIKRLEQTIMKLKNILHKQPSLLEIAEDMQISLSDLHILTSKTKTINLVSIDDYSPTTENMNLLECLPNPNSKDAFVELLLKKNRSLLSTLIEDLPQNQQIVIKLYYFEQLNLKEIGRLIEITESRVSQIHSKALNKLRIKLKSNHQPGQTAC